MYASDIIERNRARAVYASKMVWKTAITSNSDLNGPNFITSVTSADIVEQADQGSVIGGNPFAPGSPVPISISMFWSSILCTFSTYDATQQQFSIPSTTILTLLNVTTGAIIATIDVTGMSSYTFSLPILVQGQSYSYSLSTTNSYGTANSAPSATLVYLIYTVSTLLNYSSGGPCAYAITSTANGTLYFIDYYNSPASLIYTVSPGGSVTTLASTSINEGTSGIAVDSAGNIYFSDTVNNRIYKRTASTGVTSLFAGDAAGNNGFVNGTGSVARFYSPYGLALDSTGNLYVADLNNNAIRLITPSGVVSTLAGSGSAGYVDGPAASAQFYSPTGVAVSGARVYVTDSFNNRVRVITAGNVTTLAGNATAGDVDGQGTTAQLNFPTGITVDVNSTLYVTCLDNTIRLITSGGYCVTIAGITGVAGFANGQGNAATFNLPEGIAVDSTGKLYVADMTNCMIRKITPP